MFRAGICETVYAFASNETGIPIGGEGASIISDWTISHVQYRLSDDLAKVYAVEFDLDSPAEVVKMGFGSSSSGYFNCVNNPEFYWVCDINPQIKVSELNQLSVIATGN